VKYRAWIRGNSKVFVVEAATAEVAAVEVARDAVGSGCGGSCPVAVAEDNGPSIGIYVVEIRIDVRPIVKDSTP
jgi:hypothetical protein